MERKKVKKSSFFQFTDDSDSIFAYTIVKIYSGNVLSYALPKKHYKALQYRKKLIFEYISNETIDDS